MKLRRAIAICLAVVLVVAISWTVFSANKAYANPPTTVPKSFGAFKGSVGVFMIFEDAAGTLRLVNLNDGELLTIRRP